LGELVIGHFISEGFALDDFPSRIIPPESSFETLVRVPEEEY